MTHPLGATTSQAEADQRLPGVRRSVAGRTAQFLLGIPLGLFQLAAVIGFTITDPTIHRGDWLVVVWGLVMSTTCAALALRIYRSAGARRAAFAVLAAQALFSLVKLVVYHESASFVFFAIIVVTTAALAAYHSASRP
jgi:hypothetical protein